MLKNREIIFLYHFRIYILIRIINDEVATKITRLHKIMVALENLAPSKNIAPSVLLRIQDPPPPIISDVLYAFSCKIGDSPCAQQFWYESGGSFFHNL